MNLNTNNIFIFWLGDKNPKVDELINKLKSLNLNVVVGPSKEDHDFLINNVSYYKNAFESKVFAFCSDVWRVYILSKNKGVYIDTSVEIGNDFLSFYNKATSHETYLVKSAFSYVGNAVLGSGVSENKFYKKLFNEYKRLNNKYVHIYHIGPVLLSSMLRKEINYDGWEVNQEKEFYIDILPSIRNKDTIIKKGAGSWFLAKPKSNDLWKKGEEDWHARKPRTFALTRVDRVERYGFDVFAARRIGNMYERAKSHKERVYLKSLYKQVPYLKELKLFERLIWSKIFVVVTLRFMTRR